MKKPRSFDFLREKHLPRLTAREFIRYIGPGFLVTIGFIDPGNWAANLAAGSHYGYSLLWVVTIGTVFLIILQHNAAHLGIVTGYCLAEGAAFYLRPWVSRAVLASAMLATISTALAEIIGAGIALNMLVGVPVQLGAAGAAVLVLVMLWTNSYLKIERWIIGFVSLIGLAFLVEIGMVQADWHLAGIGLWRPSLSPESIFVALSVLGAVVMPSNLFLHSEIIQSRQWHLEDGATQEERLRYEYVDTIFSMLVGWAINCSIIVVAAATFFSAGIQVTGLEQAQYLLEPLVGSAASLLFAVALLLAGISASITAGIAGGSIFAGLYGESYDIRDTHSRAGVVLTMVPALVLILFIGDSFQALLISQIVLSLQLPITIFLQIYLTSSPLVMGRFHNTWGEKAALWTVGFIVTALNAYLLWVAILQ